MSLLQDVQNAAIDASVPISTLLRKCAVLATRLNNDELWAWVAKDVSRGSWKKNGALHSVIRVSDQAATSACLRTSLRPW